MSQAPNNVALNVNAGHQQVGQEMFVTIQMNIGTLTTVVAVPVPAAKHISKLIKEAAEKAEVQVIKPPSMIHQA